MSKDKKKPNNPSHQDFSKKPKGAYTSHTSDVKASNNPKKISTTSIDIPTPPKKKN